MASSGMQSHLRKYVEDGIQQKVRLSNLVLDYQVQENKSRERVIDQNSLIGKMTAENIAEEKVELVKERRDRDQDILARVKEVLGQAEEEADGLTLRMNAHMEELSEIEINAGGFVAHPIGVDQGAKIDKETKIVKFDTNGHVEMPVGVRLNKWKDSSQMTIKKIKKKAGV